MTDTTGGAIFHHTPFTIGTPEPAPLPQTTPEQARARIAEINSDKSNAYWKGFPGAVEEMARLLELAGQSEAAASASAQGESPSEAASIDVSTLPSRPDGWSAPLVQAFAQDARELGVSDDEARALLALDATPGRFIPAHGKQFLAGLGDLQEDAERAEALAFGRLSPAIQAHLETTGRKHDPRVKTALIQRGISLLDDRKLIDAIRADKTHPSNNPNHPNHQEALDELTELYRAVYGRRPA